MYKTEIALDGGIGGWWKVVPLYRRSRTQLQNLQNNRRSKEAVSKHVHAIFYLTGGRGVSGWNRVNRETDTATLSRKTTNPSTPTISARF